MTAATRDKQRQGSLAFADAQYEVSARGPTRVYFTKLKAAAAVGVVPAARDLGMWMLEGCRDSHDRVLLRRSARRAVRLFELAAAAGDSLAVLSLADCHADGIGTPQDLSKAERFYRLAARKGEHFAATNFATMLRDRGEFRRERSWLERAVRLGDPTAELTLAEIRLVSGRRPAAALARSYLLRKARSANVVLREEAVEILEHFARTGRRRWVPTPP